MNINQNILNEATETLVDVEHALFFQKLSSYGIVPKSAEEATALLQRADAVLLKAPYASPNGKLVKSASAKHFKQEVKLAQDGYSEDAHTIADQLLQLPELVKAVQVAVMGQTL